MININITYITNPPINEHKKLVVSFVPNPFSSKIPNRLSPTDPRKPASSINEDSTGETLNKNIATKLIIADPKIDAIVPIVLMQPLVPASADLNVSKEIGFAFPKTPISDANVSDVIAAIDAM